MSIISTSRRAIIILIRAIILTTSRPGGWPNSTSPAIPSTRSTSWTRTTIRSLTRSGGSTSAPSAARVRRPPCWNGTPTFRPSRKFTARRSKPGDSLKTSKPGKSPPKRQSRREYLQLQRLMAGAVMRPLARNGRAQSRWRDGRPMRHVAASFIKPNDRLSAFERLEIYNRQYWFRLLDCLYDDYPGLRAVLGDRRFARLAQAYLARHPSESFSLRNLGQHLLEFLAAEPQWVAPHQSLALDMARLEWAQIEAFDNEAKAPMTTDSLLEIDP